MTEAELIDLKERIVIGLALSPVQAAFALAAIAAAAPVDALNNNPPNYLGRIDNIWAFLSLDDGGEGVCAAPLGGMTVPLIAADKRRLDILKPIARVLAHKFAKPVRLAKFTTREDVEIYQP